MSVAKADAVMAALAEAGTETMAQQEALHEMQRAYATALMVVDMEIAEQQRHELVKTRRRYHALDRLKLDRYILADLAYEIDHMANQARRDTLRALYVIKGPTPPEVAAQAGASRAIHIAARTKEIAAEMRQSLWKQQVVDEQEGDLLRKLCKADRERFEQDMAELDKEFAGIEAAGGVVLPDLETCSVVETKDGQVLRRTSSGMSWGSIDLVADSDAVTGLLA